VGKKKNNGEWFLTRGSNHKHECLDDIDNLKYHLITLGKCIADLAREMKVPPNSINYRVKKYFTKEEQAQIGWKRRPHKNKLINK